MCWTNPCRICFGIKNSPGVSLSLSLSPISLTQHLFHRIDYHHDGRVLPLNFASHIGHISDMCLSANKRVICTLHSNGTLILTCVLSGDTLAIVSTDFIPLACCFSPLSDCIAFASNQYTSSIISLLNLDRKAMDVLHRSAMRPLNTRKNIIVYLIITMNKRRNLEMSSLVYQKDFYRVCMLLSPWEDVWKKRLCWGPSHDLFSS